MASKTMTRALADAIKSKPLVVVEDRLTAIRAKMREARNLELEITATEEVLSDLKSKLADVVGGGEKRGDLVDMMEASSVRKLTLEAEGNYPAYTAELKSFYSASLPKEPEARSAALKYIAVSLGVPDIIKNTYVVSFGKGEAKQAKILAGLLEKAKLMDRTNIAVTVHSQTLTAEVRRRFESGDPLSPHALETIGATVGKVVKLKQI